MKKMLVMAAACLMAAMTFAAQCAATTKKGTQCKRQASPGSLYCWQHGGTTKAERAAGMSAPSPERRTRNADATEQAAPVPVTDGRCQATTKAGTQCKRKATPGSRFCWQHGGAKSADGVVEETASTPRRRADKTEQASEDAAEEPDAPIGAGQCMATTKGGVRCKRKAKAGSHKCWQHDK